MAGKLPVKAGEWRKAIAAAPTGKEGEPLDVANIFLTGKAEELNLSSDNPTFVTPIILCITLFLDWMAALY